MNLTGMPLNICSSSCRWGPSPTSASLAPGTCTTHTHCCNGQLLHNCHPPGLPQPIGVIVSMNFARACCRFKGAQRQGAPCAPQSPTAGLSQGAVTMSKPRCCPFLLPPFHCLSLLPSPLTFPPALFPPAPLPPHLLQDVLECLCVFLCTQSSHVHQQGRLRVTLRHAGTHRRTLVTRVEHICGQTRHAQQQHSAVWGGIRYNHA